MSSVAIFFKCGARCFILFETSKPNYQNLRLAVTEAGVTEIKFTPPHCVLVNRTKMHSTYWTYEVYISVKKLTVTLSISAEQILND